MKQKFLDGAYVAGTNAADSGQSCDYRAHKQSVEIINSMISDDRFNYDCVEEAILEFKRGFHQTNQRKALC